MTVKLLLSDRRFSIDRRRLKTLVKMVMGKESARNRGVNIVYCTDKLIKELNARYLNKNLVTDVLAFELKDSGDGGFLGEVYVNLQQARRQALENGVNYREEVERLTVHGVLHLLGYGDRDKEKRRKMWIRQESYLNRWKK
ncbi:MAG: rRNA maturation RNase YbeY [Candidatus Zixiibacteriota bacterium]|nr:MAG: rRNA maturation RNase YbeY [candidate division Zixibacteria bacterium]